MRESPAAVTNWNREPGAAEVATAVEGWATSKQPRLPVTPARPDVAAETFSSCLSATSPSVPVIKVTKL